MRFSVRALVIVFVITAGCGGAESFESGHQTWLDRRVESLQQNWVSLAGLYWLDGQQNSIGSAADRDVVLPEDAPAEVGVVRLDGSQYHFEPAPGASVRVDGAAFEGGAISSDARGDATRLEVGPYRFSLIERYGRHAIRLHDTRRQSLVSAADLPFYSLDRAWRVEGRFEPHDVPAIVYTPTYTGDLQEMVSPGTVFFELDGISYSLDALEGGETTYFLMFHDETNADATYEAGRYLYIDRETPDGLVVIDFNRAYNPPCAFTPYATCPYPPPQNRLPRRIEAGEKRVPSDW